MGYKIARTVHLTDPETGELITLKRGEELDDEEYEEFTEKFNNPTIFEDPDASNNDNDLESMGEDQKFFAADANGEVDPETFDEKREVLGTGGTDGGTGGVEFDVDNLDELNVTALRSEYKRRQEAGIEVPQANMRDKDSIIEALRNSPSEPEGGEPPTE